MQGNLKHFGAMPGGEFIFVKMCPASTKPATFCLPTNWQSGPSTGHFLLLEPPHLPHHYSALLPS